MENTPLLTNNPMVLIVLGLLLAVLIWWISTLRKSGQSNGLAEHKQSDGFSCAWPGAGGLDLVDFYLA